MIGDPRLSQICTLYGWPINVYKVLGSCVKMQKACRCDREHQAFNIYRAGFIIRGLSTERCTITWASLTAVFRINASHFIKVKEPKSC